VLGELYFGARKSSRVAANLARIHTFKNRTTVLVCDEDTADEFGKIRELLQRKGKPIPENDIWIAAIAMQHGLTLVTRDEHFREVDGLTVERW
jgi:tRNA(fMet)-specific endonuclease VapC